MIVSRRPVVEQNCLIFSPLAMSLLNIFFCWWSHGGEDCPQWEKRPTSQYSLLSSANGTCIAVVEMQGLRQKGLEHSMRCMIIYLLTLVMCNVTVLGSLSVVRDGWKESIYPLAWNELVVGQVVVRKEEEVGYLPFLSGERRGSGARKWWKRVYPAAMAHARSSSFSKLPVPFLFSDMHHQYGWLMSKKTH